MNLMEAIKECNKGNFVSHKNFGTQQSMHAYMGSLYYEDGACITNGNYDISQERWSNDGWYVKYIKQDIDIEKLALMHSLFEGKMLPANNTYEDCLIKRAN